jgi:hypothetical protein
MCTMRIELYTWLLLPVLLSATTGPALAQSIREVASVLPAARADMLLGTWRKVERRSKLLNRMGLEGELRARFRK